MDLYRPDWILIFCPERHKSPLFRLKADTFPVWTGCTAMSKSRSVFRLPAQFYSSPVFQFSDVPVLVCFSLLRSNQGRIQSNNQYWSFSKGRKANINLMWKFVEFFSPFLTFSVSISSSPRYRRVPDNEPPSNIQRERQVGFRAERYKPGIFI